VEAGVVRDERGIAGEPEEAAHRGRDRRRPPELLVAEAGQRGDRRVEARTRVREGLEALAELEPPHANGADLARAGETRPEPRRLEVEHDEGDLLERDRLARRVGERDEVAREAQPRV